jgi:NDP-sugar pyrophosphorylase family protein
MAEIIKAFFGDGTRWGVKIDYSEEVEPLGTMGPLQNIVDLPEHFLVMNGDVITDLNYSDFYNEHIEGGAIFTISSFEREEKIDYGVISSDGDFLRGLQEKPEVKYEVSMGIYMVSREVLSFIPTGVLFGFDQLMNKLLAIKRKISVRKHPKYWLDIGRPDDYQKALNDYNSKIKENIAQLRSGK